jgi:hypothetical protein
MMESHLNILIFKMVLQLAIFDSYCRLKSTSMNTAIKLSQFYTLNQTGLGR